MAGVLSMESTSRIEKGWLLYQGRCVMLVEALRGLLTFHVKGSGGAIYNVNCYDDDWNCECQDFYNRHDRGDQCFTCKHIYASMFELGRIKQLNEKREEEGSVLVENVL